jgi:hypothetical protein
MEKEEIQRMESADDPERCQATMKRGQCEFKGLLLSDKTRASYCKLHGGNRSEMGLETASLRQYRLGQWQSKLERFADSPILKDLRDEIGILRVLLEERLLQAQTASELVLMSGPISDLIMKIEKVVASCHKLEGSMGQHLDKAAILQLAGKLTAIMSIHLKDDPEMLDRIGSDFVNLIQEETFGSFD